MSGAGSASAASATAGASGFSFGPWMFAFMALQGVSSLASSFMQSKAQRHQGDFEASTLRSNSRLARLAADDAIQRGEKNAHDHQKRVRKLVGAQRARLAAQGLDLDAGSALDIQEETAILGASDAFTIRENAYREAFGFKTQAFQYEADADFTEITARNRASQTLITGGMQFADIVARTGFQAQLLEFGSPGARSGGKV